MNFYKKISLLTLIVFVMSVFNVSAGKTTVKTKLDSTILLMGKTTGLVITVEQDKGVKGKIPLFSKIKENGIISVCGDSVELRAPLKVDTSENGNRLKIVYNVPVQSFDSGYYELPEIEFVSGNDTALSNKVALKVVPVPNLTADSPIDDYANVSNPENPSIFDALPDWMIDFWWLILLIILAAIAFVIAWRKYKKDGKLIGKKYVPTPYEVATVSLRELKEKKLWEQGMEKEYFTELTDILRLYLYGRFGINAVEMTSRQILAAMKSNPEIRDKRPLIRQILNMADFVKFAKVRPLPEDNIIAYDNARKFVIETKPVEPVEEKDGKAAKPSGEVSTDEDLKNSDRKGGKK